MKKLKLINDYVALIKGQPKEERTASGIILTASSVSKSTTLSSVVYGASEKNGDINEGDVVRHFNGRGTPFEFHGQELIAVRRDDIIGIEYDE